MHYYYWLILINNNNMIKFLSFKSNSRLRQESQLFLILLKLILINVKEIIVKTYDLIVN